MSYVATNWATGDVITAEKLNNIENGIVNNSIYMVNVTNIDYSNNTFTCDKTWNEIKTAYESGRHVIMRKLQVYTLYDFWEVTKAEIADETGEVTELQFTRIEINPGGAYQYRLVINENNNTYVVSSFTTT